MEESLYRHTKANEMRLAKDMKDQQKARLANAELLGDDMRKEARKEWANSKLLQAKEKCVPYIFRPLHSSAGIASGKKPTNLYHSFRNLRRTCVVQNSSLLLVLRHLATAEI